MSRIAKYLKLQSIALDILYTIHRNPGIPSGLRWCIKTLSAHINATPIDIMRSLTWLKNIKAIEESNGMIILTENGTKMVDTGWEQT